VPFGHRTNATVAGTADRTADGVDPAAIGPARRAARLDVLTAIAAE